MRVCWIAALLAAWALALAAPACANRIALTIGNDDYQNIESLQKAHADAKAYADALREKGFEVREGYDLTRAKLNAAIANFVAAIGPGDTAVFVYSGHGWSDGTQNYLIGVDAPKEASEDELAGETIPIRNGVDGVLDRIERKGATLRVAIIDACRDNPFTPPQGHKGYSQQRGFAPMTQPPQGTFVVFSASPGQSALDRLSEGDPDPNGVFTRVFVPLLRADVNLQDAVKGAQAKVLELARSVDHDQLPAYWDEVVGTACLADRCGKEETALNVSQTPGSQMTNLRPVALSPGIDPRDVVTGFYLALAVADGDSAASFILPSRRYGPFAPDAMSRFYGSLDQRLRLLSVAALGNGVFEARYVFRARGGHVCNGVAIVTTSSSSGEPLIESIQAPSGC